MMNNQAMLDDEASWHLANLNVSTDDTQRLIWFIIQEHKANPTVMTLAELQDALTECGFKVSKDDLLNVTVPLDKVSLALCYLRAVHLLFRMKVFEKGKVLNWPALYAAVEDIKRDTQCDKYIRIQLYENKGQLVFHIEPLVIRPYCHVPTTSKLQ